MGKRLHYKDLVGKRFDHLVVEELSSEVIYKDGYPVRLWKCKCDCGAVTYKQTATLNRNKHNSCGECTFKYRMTKLHNSAGYIDGTEISKIRNVKTTSRNRSGVRGVYFDKGKWRARLRFKGKMKKQLLQDVKVKEKFMVHF